MKTRYPIKCTLLLFYVAMAGILAVATWLEHRQGTAFVEQYIYHANWFCCCWGMISLLSVATIVWHRLWKHLPVFLLHLAFLIILAGAMTTFLFGRKGYVHLTEGTATSHYTDESTRQERNLPFTLRLDSFRIRHYPGTEAPADYLSYVTVDGQPHCISMNHIFSQAHFRLYQSSYDEDNRGSWLSVNYDPWGIGLTYTGYLLLVLSAIGSLCYRNSGFRTLLRHPLLRKPGVFVLAIGVASSVQAVNRQLPVLNRHQADSLACEQIIYQERPAIFNTLARDFVQKLSGRTSYKGLTPEQIVGGWLLHPEVWQEEPIIQIKHAELLRLLQLRGPYVSLSDLYAGNEYRLQQLWIAHQTHTGQPSSLEKAILETDEKVGLILMLRQGTLIRPLPTDGSVAPLSQAQIQAERWYNRIPFSKWAFIFTLTCGILSFFHLLYQLLTVRSANRWIRHLFSAGLWMAFVFQLTGYLLRWYVAGRIPLSNGYETMQFMALCILITACLLHQRFSFTIPFGFLLAGFALLVSHLGQMNPQITPLVPVLVSPWLCLHVSVIMIAYALLAFILLNSLLALFLQVNTGKSRQEKIEVLTLLNRLLLYPAVLLLAIGIFIGAVWANASWGRYWGWDPKEVWALITLLIYALGLHPRLLPWFQRPVFFHTFCVLAFLLVLITYFGVNFWLGGMHSYANG